MRRNGPSTTAYNKRLAAAASTLISHISSLPGAEAHGGHATLILMLKHIRAGALAGARGRESEPMPMTEVDLVPSSRLRSEASMARGFRRHEGAEVAAYASRAERRGGRHAARQALGALYRNNPETGAEHHESPLVRAAYMDLRDSHRQGLLTRDEFDEFYRSLSAVETGADLYAWEKYRYKLPTLGRGR